MKKIFLICFVLITTLSCSTTDSGGSEEGELNFKLESSKETVSPGEVVIITASLNRISPDSLSGAAVGWFADNEDIDLGVDFGRRIGFEVPENFEGTEFTVNAFARFDEAEIENQNAEISFQVEGSPIPVIELRGSIDEDSTLSAGRIYRLVRNLTLQNDNTLTIEGGAILDLNGLDINGLIEVSGSDELPAYIIGGGRISIVDANKLVYIRGANRELELDLNIVNSLNNSIIVGPVNITGTINNSEISNLNTSFREVVINNSRINNIILNDGSVSLTNSEIVSLNIEDIESTDLSARGNTINFLSILDRIGSEPNSGFIFENNNVSRIFIGSENMPSLNTNNIGVTDNGFYSDNEELIISADNSISPFDFTRNITVGFESRSQVSEYNFSNNYWAPEILEELIEKGPESNISFIFDFYDDSQLNRVVYENWVEEPFAVQ